jgi:hypothetical protein
MATTTQVISSVIAIAVVLWSAVFPAMLSLVYFRHVIPIQMSDNKSRCGILLEGVNQKSKKLALLTVFLPFLRELICALTVT